MKIKIRPMHDRIIVRRIDEDERTSGGILIPDSAKEKPTQGEVVAIGPGKVLDNGDVRPVDVKVGNKVLFGKYAGTDVKHEGKDLLVIREEDIIAIIEG